MRALVLVAMLVVATGGAAQQAQWTPMKGDEIRLALTDRTLQYPDARQEFRATGRTLYNAGQDSWGYWRVEADSYCSQWPPSDLWACYRMDRRGGMVRFVGAEGDMTEATYAD